MKLQRQVRISKTSKNFFSIFWFSANMQKFEIPLKFHLEANPWLPEDNLITAAFKLKRKALEKKYIKEITSLYSK